MDDGWHVLRAGQVFGPYVWERLLELVREGSIGADDLVKRPGSDEWVPATEVPAFFTSVALPEEAAVTSASARAARRLLPVLAVFAILAVVGVAVGAPLLFDAGPGAGRGTQSVVGGPKKRAESGVDESGRADPARSASSTASPVGLVTRIGRIPAWWTGRYTAVASWVSFVLVDDDPLLGTKKILGLVDPDDEFVYWVGDAEAPAAIYGLNLDGERASQTAGVPFLVMKLRKTTYTQEVIQLGFGLSRYSRHTLETKMGKAGGRLGGVLGQLNGDPNLAGLGVHIGDAPPDPSDKYIGFPVGEAARKLGPARVRSPFLVYCVYPTQTGVEKNNVQQQIVWISRDPRHISFVVRKGSAGDCERWDFEMAGQTTNEYLDGTVTNLNRQYHFGHETDRGGIRMHRP